MKLSAVTKTLPHSLCIALGALTVLFAGCDGCVEVIQYQGPAASSGSGGAGGAGGSAGIACEDVATCPSPAPCDTVGCINGFCLTTPTPAGSPASTDIPGDCVAEQCDGSGNVTVTNEPSDTPCSTEGGAVCDGSGTCVPCSTDEQCSPEVCINGQCVEPTCDDGLTNGDETDVDCGGPCPPCPLSAACLRASDCVQGVCACGTCYDRAVQCGNGNIDPPETCDDGNLVNDDGCSAMCVKEGAPTNQWASKVTFMPNSYYPPIVHSRAAGGWYALGSELIAFDASGGALWSYPAWGKKAFEPITEVDGDVILAQGTEAETDWGGGPIGGSTGVVRLHASDGSYVWSVGFGEQPITFGGDTLPSLASDREGNIYVSALMEGTWTVGGAVLISAGKRDSAFVKLSAGGDILWATRLGGPEHDDPTGVAVTDDGHLVATIASAGDLQCGANVLVNAGTTDIVLVEFDTTGNLLWCRRFGNDKAQVPVGLNLDAEGNIYLAGDSVGPVDFGGEATIGNDGAFFAKLDSNGVGVWAKAISTPDFLNHVEDIGVDCQGTVTFASYLIGTGFPETGPVMETLDSNLFMLRYDTAGHPLWGGQFDVYIDHSLNWLFVATYNTDRFAIGGAQLVPSDYGGNIVNCTKCPVVAEYAP